MVVGRNVGHRQCAISPAPVPDSYGTFPRAYIVPAPVRRPAHCWDQFPDSCKCCMLSTSYPLGLSRFRLRLVASLEVRRQLAFAILTS